MKNKGKMINYERFEELLISKKYTELDETELKLVNQYITNPDDYQRLHFLITQEEETYFDIQPKPTILNHLHSHLDTKQKKSQYFNVSQYAAGITILLCSVISFWLGHQTKKLPSPPEIVRLPGRVDTLRLYEKPDTVVLTKVIYRDRPTIARVASTNSNTINKEDTTGSNMKENASLSNLLVSGR